ncbi:iron-sulfur cluster assembly scaffold protein [Paracoccus pacificus]|uniref:Iron-sulfur cluster assembly scaffold protein n=1 Tax=Paracoccus pacificus TaxID=1463598 RepID=A0ABW4R558_9RHOB
MSDTDLVQLYSRQILALAADIQHLGRLPAPQGSAYRRSPQCGSSVTADVVLKDGRIAEFAQEVRACALGQASAGALGHVVLGKTPQELAAARDRLRAMLAGGPEPGAPFDDLRFLAAARDFPNRHASIMLAWEAVVAAAEDAAGAPVSAAQ